MPFPRISPWFCLGICVWLTGCATERVILLEDEGGGHGAVEIRTDRDTMLVDAPLGSATVGLLGGLSFAPVSDEAVQQGFADALSAMPPPPARFVLYFTEGTTRLVPASEPTMKALLETAEQDMSSEIRVIGHTDRVGTVEDNDRLARDRAGFVRKMLMQQGLFQRNIRAVGRGEREPLVSTEDEVAEPRNRRVEVVVR